jgi:cytoskeleton protein RodZ
MNEEKINNTFLSLKEKRKVLGLTLKDISQRTRISVVNLAAIENGNLHLLPAPIYTRNFIKTYAHNLDIDSKPIIESYEDYLRSLQITETSSPENVPENISFLAKIGQYRAYLWTAAALIFIVIVSLLISSQYQPATDSNNNQAGKMAAIDQAKKADTLSPPPQTTIPVNEQEKTTAQPASNEVTKINQIPAQSDAIKQESAATERSTTSAQNTQTTTNSEEVSLLIIKATEETWIRIKADQNLSYQVLLKPGEKIERKAASFDMDIGNAGGIKIQFKGKNIENLGKSGQVIHLRLP